MTRLTKPWWLKPETIERLKAFGQYGETQDQLINRLIDEIEHKNELFAQQEKEIQTLLKEQK